VAAGWHELVVPRRIMRQSIVRDSGQLDGGPTVQHDRHTTAPISRISLRPIAGKILLINRPRMDGTLGRRWYTDLTVTRPELYHTATSAP